jgi:hypothetical protein
LRFRAASQLAVVRLFFYPGLRAPRVALTLSHFTLNTAFNLRLASSLRSFRRP